MEKRQKRQVLNGTGNRSLNSACGRHSCIGRLSIDRRQQQHSAALWATKQSSLGIALLAPHGDGFRKDGLNKACLTPTWLASRGQRASLPSGNENERKKTANLKVACWNIRTMQDLKIILTDAQHSWAGNQLSWTSISLPSAKHALRNKAPSGKMEQAIPSSGLGRTRTSAASLVSAS